MQKKLSYLLSTAELKPEEIKIYLLLLKQQKATIQEITAKSDLNFMMVYRTIKKLYERGLIEVIQLNNKQKAYKPLSLQALIKTIDLQRRKLSRLEQSLKGLDSLLPFIDIDQEEESEGIEIKEGVDAFREEYLKFPSICKDEYLHIGSMENYWNVANMRDDCPEEMGFRNQRMAKGIYARVVDMETDVMENIQRRDSFELRTLKMNRNLPVMNNYLAMAENQSTLFICDKENPRAIVMKQKDLLDLHKNNFNTLWNS